MYFLIISLIYFRPHGLLLSVWVGGGGGGGGGGAEEEENVEFMVVNKHKNEVRRIVEHAVHTTLVVLVS